MPKKHAVLLIDDEENVIKALRRSLRPIGCQLFEASTGEVALELVQNNDIDLIICDYHLLGMNGIDFFENISQQGIDTINILLTGKPDLNMAMDAINRAVLYKVLLKPWDNDILKLTIQRALEQRELLIENKRLMKELKKREEILNDLEHKNPGITTLDTDASGYIIIDNEE